FAFTAISANAQYSARQLTRRVAPQQQPAAPAPAPAPAPVAPAPAATVAPAPMPVQPALRVVQPTVDPAQAQAEKDESYRKAAEFRKQKEDAEASEAKADNSADPASKISPLQIACGKLAIDPRESLQFLNLSLSNSVPKQITRVTMRMVYCDKK